MCQVLGLWRSDSGVTEGRQRSKLGPLPLCFPLEGGGQIALWSQLVCFDGQNLVRSIVVQQLPRPEVLGREQSSGGQ